MSLQNPAMTRSISSSATTTVELFFSQFREILLRQRLVIVCTLLHLLPSVVFGVLIAKQRSSPTGALYVKDSLPLSLFLDYFTPNTIIKLYYTCLLYFTQTLAFKQILHVKQSLTSVHDKYAAWLGAFAALMTLCKNFGDGSFRGLRKDDGIRFYGVLAITLYFVTLFVLGAIASAMVYVDRVDLTASQSLRLTDFLRSASQDAYTVKEAFPAVSMIRTLSDGQVGSNGLAANLIYDVPRDLAAPLVQTEGRQFIANCGAVSNITSFGYDAQKQVFGFGIMDDSAHRLEFMPASERLIQFKSSQVTTNGSSEPIGGSWSPTIFVATAFPLTYESELDGPPPAIIAPVPLDHAITSVGCVGDDPSCNVTQLYITGCNIDIFPTVAYYVTQSFLPVVEYDYIGGLSSVHFWRPAPSNDSTLSLIPKFPSLSPLSGRNLKFKVGNDTVIRNYTLTLLEDQIMEFLGTGDPEVRQLNLVAIQDSLERAIAVVYWKASLSQWLDMSDTEELSENWRYNPHFAFIVDIYNAAVAAGLSFLMAILSLYCTALPLQALSDATEPVPLVVPRCTDGPISPPTPSDGLYTEIGTIGILQLTWLMQRHWRILDGFREVEIPDETKLRQQGKKTEECLVFIGS